MPIKRNEFRMDQRTIQQTLLMLYFMLSYNRVEGQKNLSKFENAELEKQLKILNKPAVKTVKTKYGDTYDCVDFYKQRAFDNPLLKDHNFHPKMKSTLSTIKKDSTFSSTTNRSWTIWSKDGGCPFGTIPVKRMTKDDLVRLTHMPPPEDITFTDEYDVSNNNSRPNGRYVSSQGYKVAIAQISYNPHNKFAGAGMSSALYNPQVNGQQHSGSRLKIHKGSDILQAGWRVDPTLYGDTKTRFFIHFQAGKIHCFNTLCPGFVQVNHDFPLDYSFMHIISQRGGKIWSVEVHIDRDLSGNWWLLMRQDFTRIGFWPQSLFTDLKSFATNVDWGGVVYSPPGVPKPPMGSSYFPIENSSYDAYCDDLTIINEKGETIEVDTTITHTDNPYKVEFIQLSRGAKHIYFVLYGGPSESTHV
ncbi:protein neprosin-like [Solanum lycopersicum]|uniref:protein neprosin-like n=1 Tax=Solanum lycopersicum TaxID=4081 RepID=UPI00374A1F60